LSLTPLIAVADWAVGDEVESLRSALTEFDLSEEHFENL